MNKLIGLPLTQADCRLPKVPVLDWAAFGRTPARPGHSVASLPHVLYTTSGRAALFHALQQLRLAPGSRVLVPTYHCPTMVAPVLCAGLVPQFFGIDADGLPQLDTIEFAAGAPPRAMFVAHYFGLPKSLARVRAWCDAHRIALVEDCAHALFGSAGERPVGSWGDFATASLSKFYPLPEAGVLASARRSVAVPGLERASAADQLKGVIDVLEHAVAFDKLPGLNGALRLLFQLKNGLAAKAPADAGPGAAPSPIDEMMTSCDLDRIRQSPLWISLWLHRVLPADKVIARRRANFSRYRSLLGGAAGVRPLFTELPDDAAPYVFPLWVDDADRIYEQLRRLHAPVFRWDRIWPGTPPLPGDAGPGWSRHVIQLLCHQALDEADAARVAHAVLALAAA